MKTNAKPAGAVLALLLASAAETASAQTAPTRLIEESELYVRLWTPSPETGYVLRVDGIVYGIGSSQDAIRVDVRQGTRTISTVRCPFDAIDSDGAGRLRCQTDSSHPLTQTGALVVDIVYVDDVAETTATLRTLNLRVNAYPYWVRTDGSRQIMGSQWQIDGSDQLGTAFAYMAHPSLQQTEANEEQHMELYTSFSGSYQGRSSVLRCTAGGERIPDREVSMASLSEFGADERLSPTAEIRQVGWYRARFTIQALWWGTRISIPASGSGYNTEQTVFLGDHPGPWSCDLRSEGHVLRAFRFDVDATGRVVAHAEESGDHAMRLVPGLHLVDVRLPNPNAIDTIVDPAAIRAGGQFGWRWQHPEAVAAMLAALPPASGSAAPTRGGGRRH